MSNDRNSLEITKRKKARGAMLGLLAESYPTGIASGVMERLLAEAGISQAHELPRLVEYLKDKKYIIVSVPEEPDVRPLPPNTLLELSAHGVDLLEGSIPDDPGVDF